MREFEIESVYRHKNIVTWAEVNINRQQKVAICVVLLALKLITEYPCNYFYTVCAQFESWGHWLFRLKFLVVFLPPPSPFVAVNLN
jgi:hypothetical protein